MGFLLFTVPHTRTHGYVRTHAVIGIQNVTASKYEYIFRHWMGLKIPYAAERHTIRFWFKSLKSTNNIVTPLLPASNYQEWQKYLLRFGWSQDYSFWTKTTYMYFVILWMFPLLLPMYEYMMILQSNNTIFFISLFLAFHYNFFFVSAFAIL